VTEGYREAGYCEACDRRYCRAHMDLGKWNRVVVSSDAEVRTATCPEGHEREDFRSDVGEPIDFGG